MTIRAGRLRARLTVTSEQLVDRPDGGQDIQHVAVVVDAGADVVPIASEERLQVGGQFATATHRAHLRQPYDATGRVIVLTPAMTATAKHGATGTVTDYGIVSVTDVDGRGKELELVLEERVT